jgi:hypothetical protein
MGKLWAFLRKKTNREIIAWLGGGVVVVIAALWTAFVYLFPPKREDGSGSIKVEANCGSAAVHGNLVGSSITIGGNSSKADCPPKSN